jgi:Secretion system C-terminal sorting domain
MNRLKLFFQITLILYITNLNGQEFSFAMIFQDSKGNSDTLIFGYDSQATDSVDNDFGEINIISTKIDSLFDIRVTDEWINKQGGVYLDGNYHLKKQIIKKNCNSWPTAISVDIKCKHWPVTAKWDSSIFNDPCKNGSLITSIPPGGWWDVGCPSDLIVKPLSYDDHVTFTSNFDGSINENYNYLNHYNDTISVFWVAITYHDILHSGEPPDNVINNTINEINIYPNPTSTCLFLKGLDCKYVDNIEIFDLKGIRQEITIKNEAINIEDLNNGIYLLKIYYLHDIIITKKIIKY